MEPKKLTILYERLSRDDGEDGVSNSILNQQSLLADYADRNNLVPYEHIQDDGWSGTRWDRPGWKELIARVDAGEVGCIVIKDSSRMGRDYLRVGLYREMFREKGVRLIAVNDGIDSFLGEDDLVPFREIMAEWYARDCSKKIKSVYRHKGMSGVRLVHHPMYGYKKADTVKNSQWVIDEPAAAVVRRIFSLTVEGYGVTQIATILSNEKVESPAYYLAQRGYGQHLHKEFVSPYRWWGDVVDAMIRRVEYLGHTVNFKTTSKSFKSKKRYGTAPEEQMVFENTHEAIIGRETWELANRLRDAAKRCISKVDGEMHPLTGLMFCAQCGSKMYHQRSNPTAKSQKNDYLCASYRKHIEHHCTPHRVTQKAVEELILAALRTVSAYAIRDEEGFKRKVTEMFSARMDGELKTRKKRLDACEKRSAELDRLIKRLFEEQTLGSMSEKRFGVLSAEYEQEQDDLESEIADLRAGIDSYVDSEERAQKFLALTKRYTDFTELTVPMLNEFVSRVEVHERAEKKCKYTEQTVDIYLSFIGNFSVPMEARDPIEIEEEAKEKEHAERVQKRRQYYRDYYLKRKENGGKPLEETRTPEEIAAAEAARKERRREYEREYHRRKMAEKRATALPTKPAA